MQVPNDARALTKPPPWHGWVTADLFLSELSSGTFVVAAVGQLTLGDRLGRLAQIGFVLALGAILLDLICLVADLGDPGRFFHMLRRLKLRSPMSLGVWGISIYAMFAFGCAAMATARIEALEKIQLIVATVGIVPALFVGLYKGVLFSTSAQPVWRDARWLGTELAVSAGIIGAATMLLVAMVIGAKEPIRPLRTALAALSAVELVALALFLNAAAGSIVGRLGKPRWLVVYLSIGLGGLVTPGLIAAVTADSTALLCAAVLALGGALVSRHYLIILPHEERDDSAFQIRRGGK